MAIKKISLQDSNLNKIWLGLLILLFGLLFPKFLENRIFEVLNALYTSISRQDSGLLLIASAKLVMFNTIRHVPIYTGSFILAEGLYSTFKIQQLGFIISIIFIPITYQAISQIYDISFVFAGPAYLTVLGIFILHQTTVRIKPILIKVVIITIFLFGLDWLDIVPMLSQYGFGQGEIAVSIKQATEFIEATYTMNFVGLIFSFTIVANALILAKVVIDYYNKLALIEESRLQEERLSRLEVEAVKSRYMQEVKHLVHDLKSPLVTIQGLSEVINLKIKDKKIKEYTERIYSSSDKMSLMITEMLYHDKMNLITVKELFDSIRIQLPPNIVDKMVKFEIEDLDLVINVNKIRVSRAIINLIENGLRAIDDNGFVLVRAGLVETQIKILVKDNGVGIPLENLKHIWKVGYTTGMSNTGLGLNFVKQIVENHYGHIELKSSPKNGTEVSIFFPEVKIKGGQNSSCG